MESLHIKFTLTLLFSEICSIFKDNKKLRLCVIIFKHINEKIN